VTQACLNAPEPAGAENGVDANDVPAESPEDVNHATVGAPPANMARPGTMHPGYMTNEQQQQMAYYQNLQQQQQAGGQYPGMPVGGRIPPQHQPTA
jgi:MADS-box transcription factor